MTRLTFYRKYRSQTFAELVGQEHVVQTLSNAITNNRLAHAYIFSGPRGTGKTSIARIFAKAVNSYEKEQQFEDLSNELCQRINQGVCVDIVEIDAASNTGVDNIRDLNEKVNFSPVECNYKFYIIDEAHMLSSGAFNALLKTVEEPPSNTIFILATTEPHKIPITIHSRCQHLRFRNLTDQEICSQLQHICEKESITLSENGRGILARNSSGCMRDALSLLDQMYSFKGTTITDDDIVTILGATDINQLGLLLKAITTKQPKKLLETLQNILKTGVNPLQLLKDLIQISEQLLAFKSDYLEAVTYNKSFIENIANNTTLPFIITLLDCLTKTDSETRWMSNPGLLIEIRLMQLITPKEHHPQQKTSTTQQQSQPKPQQTMQQTHSAQNNKTMKIQQEPYKPIQQHSQKNSSEQNQNPFSKQNPFNKSNTIQKNQQQNKTSFNTPENQPTSTQYQKESIIEKKLTSNELSTQQNIPIPAEEMPAKWPKFLTNLKNSHPNIFTILRDSQLQSCNNNSCVIQLNQPVQFFIDKLNESQYKTIVTNELSKFYNKSLTFELNTQQQQSPTTQQKKSTVKQESTTPNSTSKDTNTIISSKEKSLNDIVSLFEGAIV